MTNLVLSSQTKQHLEDAWEYVETACNQVGAPIPEVAEGGELPAMLKFCCPVEETCVPRSKVMELLQSKETVHVYMHGRSNLFSVGVLHDIKNGVLTKYPIGSRSGTEYIVAAQALVIKSPPSPSPTTAAAFSAAGDSGSVVRLKDGKILGFLYCSVNSNYSNSTVSHVVLGEDVGKGIADMLNARNVDFKTASLHSMI